MKPILFHIGNLGFPAFFFMIMIAALAATFFASYMARREGADPVAMLDFGIIAIIASVVGSRVFHILFESPSHYLERPIRIFFFWQGGFVSMGAFLASALGWILYMRYRKLHTWRYMDIAVLSVPIIVFFVRIGCLLVGCCYGKPTDFFINIVFTDPQVPAGMAYLGVPLHPTQIYSMANAAVMWGVLLLVYRHRKFYGQVTAAFLIYYSITRFMIEFLRSGVDRKMLFGGIFSIPQVVLVFSLALGLILWIVLRKRHPIARA